MRQGYYDGQIVQLTKRHQQRRRKRKGADERAVLAEQHLPDPGAHTAASGLAFSHVACVLVPLQYHVALLPRS